MHQQVGNTNNLLLHAPVVPVPEKFPASTGWSSSASKVGMLGHFPDFFFFLIPVFGVFKAKDAPRTFLRRGFWLGLGWSSSAPKVGGLGHFPEFLSQFLVCLRLCGVRDAPPHQRFWPGLSWSSSASKVGILGHFPEFLSQFLVCLKPWWEVTQH